MKGTRGHETAVMIAALLLGGVAWAAKAGAGEQSTPTTQGDSFGVPQTAEEHFARAASYTAKAASYREEAAAHRKMFADYDRRQGNPALQSKAGRELPWIAKMRGHCDTYIKEAERMATGADRFAEFHRMRGAEMQGK